MTKKHFSPRNIFHLTIALTILIVTFACGGNFGAPPSSSAEEPSAAIEPTFTAPTEGVSGDAAPSPAIPETRRLTLEYPPKMKADAESDIIRLILEVDEQGTITPTALVEGNVITGEAIQIPNLYETHMVTAEARIDMAGMDVQPPSAIFEPMNPGQSVTFFWSIRPQNTGLYRGTVWLHLVFVDRISGEESRMAVSAQIVEIEAVDFFGFSVNVARTSGVVGSVIGGIVGFPFLEDIIKFLFKRRKKK